MPDLLSRVLYWTGGPPYLTQRLCLDLAEQMAAGAPVDVDQRCAALFYGSRTRQEETNLAFVQNTLLELTDDTAALLELYRQIWRGRRVPDDPTSPLVRLICLSGVALPRNERLVVRNRIYRRVFDLAWIETSMPHAELRRLRAAYRRGVLRTLAVSLLILSVVAGLGWNAVLNARRAADAAHQSAMNAKLYQVQRDIATRETEKEIQATQQAKRDANRAQIASTKAQAATRWAEIASQQRKVALTVATQARTRESEAHRKTLDLLAESQADQGVQKLQRGDAAGLLDLAESCASAAGSPDVLAQRSALWYDWYRECSGELTQIIAPPDGLQNMQFLPQNGWLVTDSFDGSIRFWDCRTGGEARRALNPGGPVDLLAVSPDGRYLAAATHDNGWSDESRVVLWDLRTGRAIPIDLDRPQKSLKTPSADRNIVQIVFTPDSRQLAVVVSPTDYPDSVIWVFDAATGTEQKQWLRPGILDFVHFASHAPLLLTHGRRAWIGSSTACLSDIRTG